MVYFFYNSSANNGTAGDLLPEAKKLFVGKKSTDRDLVGLNFAEIVKTLSPEDEIVICGGDGTLNRFANQTYGYPYPCPIYLYKAGTGNDFIRDVTDDDKKVKLVRVNEHLRRLPTVTVNDSTRRYVNNVAYGIDGMVCEVADRQKERGKRKINFSLIALRLLFFGYHPANAKVTVDGVTKTYRRVWMAPAMNGRYFGGGMMAAPAQRRDSDTLTVTVIHNAGRFTTIRMFPTIFKGTHVKNKKIADVRVGKHIEVEFDRPCALQIDGETVCGVRSFRADKE